MTLPAFYEGQADYVARLNQLWALVDPDTQLLGWAAAFAFRSYSATVDADDVVTSATFKWPDGTDGEFTPDVFNADFPGTPDAWHFTYLGTPTKTITQPLVTRSATGRVILAPDLVIT